jgi:hypothetical protein
MVKGLTALQTLGLRDCRSQTSGRSRAWPRFRPSTSDPCKTSRVCVVSSGPPLWRRNKGLTPIESKRGCPRISISPASQWFYRGRPRAPVGHKARPISRRRIRAAWIRKAFSHARYKPDGFTIHIDCSCGIASQGFLRSARSVGSRHCSRTGRRVLRVLLATQSAARASPPRTETGKGAQIFSSLAAACRIG